MERKLAIYSRYALPRFFRFFKYFFYYFWRFCFISKLFIFRFFHRNLVRFVKALFISPWFFSSHFTLRLLFNRPGTFEQLLIKLESIHATESLNKNLFFSVSQCLPEIHTHFNQSWLYLSFRQRSHHKSQCHKPTFWIKI